MSSGQTRLYDPRFRKAFGLSHSSSLRLTQTNGRILKLGVGLRRTLERGNYSFLWEKLTDGLL